MVVPDAQGIRAALLNVFRPGKEISVDPEAFLASGMIASIDYQTQTSAANAAQTLDYSIPANTSDAILGFVVSRARNAAGAGAAADLAISVFLNGVARVVSNLSFGELNNQGATELQDTFLANPTPAAAVAIRAVLAAGGVGATTVLSMTVVRARFPGIELGQVVA